MPEMPRLYVRCAACTALIAPQNIEDHEYSVSRYGPVIICERCGSDEAELGDFAKIAATFRTN